MLITLSSSIIVLNVWYKASLTFDLVCKRELYYDNFYTAQKLLNESMILAKTRFDIYKTNTINIGKKVIMQGLKDKIIITVKEEGCLLSCVLNEQFFIEDFTIGLTV